VEQTLDLSFVRTLALETYACGGRPSVDPVVFFKLQLVMFFDGIRSERQLMQVSADRLSVRWYLGYDLSEPLPDHSSLTRIRTRYGVEIFRRFFEAIVEQCQQAGLVWGKELYFDATKVNANAGLASIKPRFAVEAHLAELFPPEAEAQQEATTSAQEPETSDHDQPTTTNDSKQGQRSGTDPQKADKNDPCQLVSHIPEVVHEELTKTNKERHDWIERLGRPNRDVTHGSYQRIADLRVSTTDPDATMMYTNHLGYHTHYVVDGGKSRIILAALVTPSEVMENQPILDLLWQARFRWKLWPRQATGDTTYGTLENIVALEHEHIKAYVPLPDFDQRTPFYGQRDFRYDAEQDTYTCPNGMTLHLKTYDYTEHMKRYKGDATVCNACPLKSQCTTSDHGRVLTRSLDEDTLQKVRAYHQTEPYKKAIRKRSVWVEPLFAEGKDWHSMRRFRLRRLWRVNTEALMRAAGQNFKRLLKKRGWGRRPWPEGAVGARSQGLEDEEQQMNATSRRERARSTIASMVSLGSTRELLNAKVRLFSQTVFAQIGAPSSADAQSFSFLFASLCAFVYLLRDAKESSLERLSQDDRCKRRLQSSVK
jgi:transposase